MSWVKSLPDEVFQRLGNCQSRKSDIETLVNVKWSDMVKKGKKEQGFTKEDALISVLELLVCNDQYFDLTEDECNELSQDIVIKHDKNARMYNQSMAR